VEGFICFKLRFRQTRSTSYHRAIGTIKGFYKYLKANWTKEIFWKSFSDEKVRVNAGH